MKWNKRGKVKYKAIKEDKEIQRKNPEENGGRKESEESIMKEKDKNEEVKDKKGAKGIKRGRGGGGGGKGD